MTIPTSGLFALLAPRKVDILAGAMARCRLMGAAPTIDMVKDAALEVAKAQLGSILLPECKATLDGAVMLYQVTRGPRPEGDYNAPEIAEWRDAFDESIMDAIGVDALRLAGQDFIGEFLTDSEIDEETVRDAAASKMANNIVQTSIGDRQPGQVLAEIGIVAEDLQKLAPNIAPGGLVSAGTPTALLVSEPVARAHVERLVGTWAISQGIGAFDMDATTALLKTAFDDDPFIPLSAILSIGGKNEDAIYFAAYFKAAGKDAVANTASAAMMAALTGQIIEMPKGAPKPRKGKKSEPGANTSPVPPPSPPPVSPVASSSPVAAGKDDISEVIKLLHQHGSATDEELGVIVGKSRATVKNVRDGKTTLKVTADQKAALRAHILARAAGLQQAVERLS